MLDQSIVQNLSDLADAAESATLKAVTAPSMSGFNPFTGSTINWDAVNAARASYSAFWNLQTSSQPNATPAQNATINGLNARVHAAWGRLEDWLIEFDDPSQRAAHSSASQEAFADAKALSSQAGQSTRQQTSYGNQQTQAKQDEINATKYYIDTSYGKAFSDQVKATLNEKFFGVPMWAWGTVALVGTILILDRK